LLIIDLRCKPHPGPREGLNPLVFEEKNLLNLYAAGLRTFGKSSMEVSMPQLPENPDFNHLKKQAKDLLRLYQGNNPEAFERFRKSLPAAAGKDDVAIAALGLKLHDVQSCIAREYGLPAWQNLRNYVDWCKSKLSTERKDVIALWLHKAYGHDDQRADPVSAARQLREIPDFVQDDLHLACAIGDEETVRRAIARDPSCVNRIQSRWPCPGCKRNLGMPPLFAVAHTTLLRIPMFRGQLHRCARLLLDAGADPNQSWRDRDTDPFLSSLYGTAGKNHDPELTRMLLEAGANPNDSESLYHSIESHDRTCTRLLLEAGAKVEGSNALHHQLDRDDIDGLRLLLQYTRDVNDTESSIGRPLIWAIRRRRSAEHVKALLASGADPKVKTKDGVSAYLFALHFGMTDIAELLRDAGGNEPLSIEDQFVAACARIDRVEARRILDNHPDIFTRMSEVQLRQLPNLTETRTNDEAVRLMVELGWPITVRGGDWSASALNLAVYRGNAELTRFLLEHGSTWTERHGHDGNASGILGWASRNETPRGDWLGCAKALVEHGMPIPVKMDDYSKEVVAYFEEVRRLKNV
jgi:ankyrin repeat protein